MLRGDNIIAQRYLTLLIQSNYLAQKIIYCKSYLILIIVKAYKNAKNR